MGRVIDKALEYIEEAEAQNEGPERKQNITYWRAFLSGAKAQQREDKNQERNREDLQELARIQDNFLETLATYARSFEELSRRVDRVTQDLQGIVDSRKYASTSAPVASSCVETPEGNKILDNTVYSYGTKYGSDLMD